MASKAWYKRNWVVISFLFFLPPIGAALTLTTDWPRKRKLIVSGLGLLWWPIALAVDGMESQQAELPREPVGTEIEVSATAPQNAVDVEEAQEVEEVEEAEEEFYSVVSVQDGDTLTVFQEGEEVSVRLACIDSPESNQPPHGERATVALEVLAGEEVSLNVVDTDRYGRKVAEVYTPGGNFINLRMVQAGNAVVYTQYLDSCSEDNRSALVSGEEGARADSKGVWADTAFVMPWDYRDGVRAEEPEPEPEPVIVAEPTPEPAQVINLPSCVNSDCNCSDFSSWRQAQDVLESSPGDPHRLDRDKDGIACESLQ